MLSNKLTFSLVFLVVLALMFAFIAPPAMAQALNPVPAANSSVVVTKIAAGAGNGLTGQTVQNPTGDDAIPNLEEFFRWGGTIELQMAVGGPASATHTIDLPTGSALTGTAIKALTDDEKAAIAKAAKHRAVITEVMWGLDHSGANADAEVQAQWIEVYNDGAALLGADALTLVFHPNTTQYRVGEITFTPTDSAAPDGDGTATVVVDSVSTRNRFNVAWTPKGNSGNTTELEGAAPKALVSMYRKRDLDGNKYKADKTFGRGDEAGSWEASSGRVNLTGYFVGSPLSVHVDIGGTAIHAKAEVAAVKNAGSGLIINEFRNDNSEKNVDWVELHNNSDTAVTVDGRRLWIVTATLKDDGTYENPIQTLTAILPKYEIPAGGYLLVVNRDPKDTILAGGVNLNDDKAKRLNKGAKHTYWIDSRLNLPNAGNFLLVLRSGDKDNTHEQFVDFAGNGMYMNTGTEMWPLRGWAALSGDHFTKNVTLNRDLVASGVTFARKVELKDDGQYRAKSGDSRLHKDHWKTDGNMGGVGYDRDVDLAIAPGTPGYANMSPGYTSVMRADKSDYMFDGMVTISEIMYDAGPRWNQVQWIELHNSSMTQAVNLDGWELEIRNKEDVDSYVDSIFKFNSEAVIAPNQTLLLVSGPGSHQNVPRTRVYNLFEHHRTDLGLLSRQPNLLSRTGFNLKLYARIQKDGQDDTVVHDEVGNVKVTGAKRDVQWSLLDDIKGYDATARQSIVRQYGTRYIDGRHGDGTDDGEGPDDAGEGTMMSSWRYSDIAGAGLTYYGHQDDVGTPGYHLGGPLPVSLSSFRPVRDKATGEVVVRWITQSELNNAGFNILRSETRNGAFKVVNIKGIVPGHGTTSEKHVYEWKDTSAKPNVVYYYQIEDVSLDGNRTLLTTTRLKGHVSAAGKLTTTWSRLKQRD